MRAVQMGPCATATPPNRTGGAIAPKLRARLYPVVSPRRISFGGVLSSSLRAHIEVFGSAAATKCSRPRRWPVLRLLRKTPRARAFRGGGAPKNL